jgi:hypothetical protein
MAVAGDDPMAALERSCLGGVVSVNEVDENELEVGPGGEVCVGQRAAAAVESETSEIEGVLREPEADLSDAELGLGEREVVGQAHDPGQGARFGR